MKSLGNNGLITISVETIWSSFTRSENSFKNAVHFMHVTKHLITKNECNYTKALKSFTFYACYKTNDYKKMNAITHQVIISITIRYPVNYGVEKNVIKMCYDTAIVLVSFFLSIIRKGNCPLCVVAEITNYSIFNKYCHCNARNYINGNFCWLIIPL